MFQFLKLNARWLAGAFLLALCSSFGQTFFVSLFSEDIRAHFELTDGQFGTIYMLATLASAAVFLNLGTLVDHFSISSVAVFVLLAVALACVGMTFANSVWFLAICLFSLRLFGQGMLLHTSQTAIGRWFDAERGKAISLTSMGLNAGEATLPVAVWAASLYFSWQVSWSIAAIVAVAAVPVCYSLMKVPRDPKPQATQLLESKTKRQWTRWEVLRDPLFWLSGPGVFAPAFIVTAVFFHHKHLVAIKAWPEGSFATAFAMLSISTIIAKLFAGSLIDRYGSIKLVWIYHIPLGVSCLLLAMVNGAWVVYPAMILIGVAMGLATSIFGTLWPEVYGTKHLGAVRSVAVSGVVFFSACGSGVTGMLIDGGLGFETQLVALAVWCGFSVLSLKFVSTRMLERLAKY